MPLFCRSSEPTFLSRHPLGSNIKDELQAVNNSTLSGVVKQLASVAKHADSIFGDLLDESCKLLQKVDELSYRITTLEGKISHLNAKKVPIPAGDIHTFPELTSHYKASYADNKDTVTLSNRTFSLCLLHTICDISPAILLRGFDSFRDDEILSESLFTVYPCISTAQTDLEPEDDELQHKRPTSLDIEDIYGKSPVRTPTKRMSVALSESLKSSRQSPVKSPVLPTPEEVIQQSLTPAEVVPVDVTGSGFVRMMQFRRSLVHSDYESKPRKRRQRTKRRITMSGLPRPPVAVKEQQQVVKLRNGSTGSSGRERPKTLHNVSTSTTDEDLLDEDTSESHSLSPSNTYARWRCNRTKWQQPSGTPSKIDTSRLPIRCLSPALLGSGNGWVTFRHGSVSSHENPYSSVDELEKPQNVVTNLSKNVKYFSPTVLEDAPPVGIAQEAPPMQQPPIEQLIQSNVQLRENKRAADEHSSSGNWSGSSSNRHSVESEKQINSSSQISLDSAVASHRTDSEREETSTVTGYNSDASAVSNTTLKEIGQSVINNTTANSNFTKLGADLWLQSLDDKRALSPLQDDVFDEATDTESNSAQKAARPLSLLRVAANKKAGHSFSTHSSTSTVLDLANRSLAGSRTTMLDVCGSASEFGSSPTPVPTDTKIGNARKPPPPPKRVDSLNEMQVSHAVPTVVSQDNWIAVVGMPSMKRRQIKKPVAVNIRDTNYPSDEELLHSPSTDIPIRDRLPPKYDLPIALSKLPLPTDVSSLLKFRDVDNSDPEHTSTPRSSILLRERSDSGASSTKRLSGNFSSSRWSGSDQDSSSLGSLSRGSGIRSSGSKKKPSIILSGNALNMAKQLSEEGTEFCVEVTEGGNTNHIDRSSSFPNGNSVRNYNSLPRQMALGTPTCNSFSTERHIDIKTIVNAGWRKTNKKEKENHGNEEDLKKWKIKSGAKLFGSLPRQKRSKDTPSSASTRKNEPKLKAGYDSFTLPRRKPKQGSTTLSNIFAKQKPSKLTGSRSTESVMNVSDVRDDYYSDYECVPLQPSLDTAQLPRHFTTKKEDLPDVGFGMRLQSPGSQLSQGTFFNTASEMMQTDVTSGVKNVDVLNNNTNNNKYEISKSDSALRTEEARMVTNNAHHMYPMQPSTGSKNSLVSRSPQRQTTNDIKAKTLPLPRNDVLGGIYARAGDIQKQAPKMSSIDPIADLLRSSLPYNSNQFGVTRTAVTTDNTLKNTISGTSVGNAAYTEVNRPSIVSSAYDHYQKLPGHTTADIVARERQVRAQQKDLLIHQTTTPPYHTYETVPSVLSNSKVSSQKRMEVQPNGAHKVEDLYSRVSRPSTLSFSEARQSHVIIDTYSTPESIPQKYSQQAIIVTPGSRTTPTPKTPVTSPVSPHSSAGGGGARINITHLNDTYVKLPVNSGKVVITPTSNKNINRATVSVSSSAVTSPTSSFAPSKKRKKGYINLASTTRSQTTTASGPVTTQSVSPSRTRNEQLRAAFFTNMGASDEPNKLAPIDMKFSTWSPKTSRLSKEHSSSCGSNSSSTTSINSTNSSKESVVFSTKMPSQLEPPSTNAIPLLPVSVPKENQSEGKNTSDKQQFDQLKKQEQCSIANTVNEMNDNVANFPKTYMTQDELFAAIHRTKKKLNIKSDEEMSSSPRSSSPAFNVPAKEIPETGVLSPRNSYAEAKKLHDRQSKNRQTTMHDFKMLLLQQSKHTVGIENKKLSAVEVLKTQSSTPSSPIKVNGAESTVKHDQTIYGKHSKAPLVSKHVNVQEQLTSITEDAQGEQATSPHGYKYISTPVPVKGKEVDEAAVNNILDTIKNTQKVLNEVTDV